MKSPILGSSYVARSVNAADNRMVNLFPEIVPEGGKEPAFLQRAPGMTAFTSLAGGPIRGMYAYKDVSAEILFVVVGDDMYRISTSGFATLLGDISAGLPSITTPVVFDYNGEHIVVTTGPNGTGASQMFVVDIATLTLSQVTSAGYLGHNTLTYLDGYIVSGGRSSNNSQQNVIQCSDLLDATVYNSLAFSSVDASPDVVVRVIANNGELWVFGADSTEVWSNVGGVPFPFAPIQGSFTETGCAAYASVAKLDNSLFWLGKDSRGQGVIYRTNGYRAERVSTHAVEWQIQRYADISDAVAYTYQQDGHAFYVITFPTGDATWVYDFATQAWHERASWNGSVFSRHIANCQAFFNGSTMVGCTDGAINILSTDEYKDVSTTIKWLRSWRALPTGQNNLKRTAHHSLQLDLNSSVDDDDAPNPEVSLRWSDDGGHTWNDPRSAYMSAIASPNTRVIFRRLGMTTSLRDRVYEISGTSAVPVYVMGAELILSPTDA